MVLGFFIQRFPQEGAKQPLTAEQLFPQPL